MAKNRTTDTFRSSFRKGVNQIGHTSGYYYINTRKNQDKKVKEKDEVRRKIQSEIKSLVEQKMSVEEIKRQLQQNEGYKSLEQYFDQWIEHWILNVNTDIKANLKKLIGIYSDEKEVIEQIRNNPVYEKYKNQIENDIRITLEAKNKKIKEKMQKEEER